MTDLYVCPVCGYPGLDEPARRPSGGPSFETCPCCGFEFGYTDGARGESDESWRQKWIAGGMRWSGDTDNPPPPNWDPRAQLAALDPNSG